MGKIKLFLRGLVEGFKSFGLSVSQIINFILLFIVYFTAIGLTSLIGKIFRKHFINLGGGRKKSNWVVVKKRRQKFENYRRML